MGRPGQTRHDSGRWSGLENPQHGSEENGKTTDQSVEAETPAARFKHDSGTAADSDRTTQLLSVVRSEQNRTRQICLESIPGIHGAA